MEADPSGPLEGNLYGYAGGNPVRYVDLNGDNPLLFAWAVWEIGSSLYDAWSVIRAYNDKCASAEEKLLLTGALVAGIFGPGGGYGKAAKELTGQWHHVISRSVYAALREHPNLKGLYNLYDERLVIQAKNLMSHRGYQEWHRVLDHEIADYVSTHERLTRATFERYLRHRYGRADLLERFPTKLGRR